MLHWRHFSSLLPLLAHDGHSFDSYPNGVAKGFGLDAIPIHSSSWWLLLFVFALHQVTPCTPYYPNKQCGIAAVFGLDAIHTAGIMQIIALIGVLECASCKTSREPEMSSLVNSLMGTSIHLGHIG
jgi:hypothetical protein